jgi:hypothetical protein
LDDVAAFFIRIKKTTYSSLCLGTIIASVIHIFTLIHGANHMKTLTQTELHIVAGGWTTNANHIDRIAIPAGLATGIGIGATIGACTGGPVGAALGAVIGSLFGTSVGAAAHPVADLIKRQ